MTRRLILFVSVLLTAMSAAQGGEPIAYTVSYVSAEHVYIDAGRADGLTVGDRLARVDDNGNTVAELQVVYTALHSASCRFIGGDASLAAGDRLIVIARASLPDSSRADTAPPPPVPVKPATVDVVPTSKSSNNTNVFGNVSMSVYRRWDNSDANVDFTQTSARMNLRAENVLMPHATLAIRTRGRYDARNRAYLTGGAETEWKNRLWVLSLEYDDPDAVFSLQAGRFLPDRLGGAGYLDGALLRARFSTQFQAALLAGQRPEWAYGEGFMSLTRYGGYVSYQSMPATAMFVEQTIGILAEYHRSTPSRTFLAWRGSLRSGAAVGISHSLELDVNRGWRLEKSGESVTLSNLFVHSWLRAGRLLRISLQYDNRQNYWTYERRSLADSLFDSRVRHGFRGRLDVAATSRTHLSGSVGYRTTEGNVRETISYSGSLRRSGLFGYNLTVMLSVFGFNGDAEYGRGYTVRTQLPPGSLGNFYCAVAGYSYSVEGYGQGRSSTSFEVGTTIDISGRYYVGTSGEWDIGDDIDGVHTFLEFGYRY